MVAGVLGIGKGIAGLKGSKYVRTSSGTISYRNGRGQLGNLPFLNSEACVAAVVRATISYGTLLA